YLRSRGIETIDTLVVSHLDVEHAGGTAAVLQALRPTRLLTGFDARLLQVEPETLARVEHQPCAAGASLSLGTATVDVIHPSAAARHRKEARDNAAGCVLRIVSPAGAVLLTADLPSAVEPLLSGEG